MQKLNRTLGWLALSIGTAALALPSLGAAKKSDKKKDDRPSTPISTPADPFRDPTARPIPSTDPAGTPPTTQPATQPADVPSGIGKKTQGQLSREAVEKQKDIARGLRDKSKGAAEADEIRSRIASLQAQLDSENTRHTSQLAELQKNFDAAKASGNSKSVDRAQRAIDKENASYADRTSDINKKISALQTRAADGAIPR